MLRKLIAIFVLLTPWVVSAQPAPKFKLVLAIAADQFRYDYLTRFQSEYKDGLNMLLTRGAVFTSARFEHFPTVTAIGHSTFMTGATPSLSGIVGNEWYDRESGKSVTSVSDERVKILGSDTKMGASPHRLLVSTLGDELKSSNQGKSRVIGISLKDRSAILPAGHMADGAFWFDDRTGSFVSSSFYFADLPAWVKEFNAGRPTERYRGAEWMGKKLPQVPGRLDEEIVSSPFGSELVEALAERAIQGEHLGDHGVADLLVVSFSSNDYVGHRYGPDSPQVHDMCLQTDRILGKLLQFVDKQIGLQNVLVVFTADHGVAPLPEQDKQRRMPGGRMKPGLISETVQKALEQDYGPGKWIVGPSEYSLYLNRDLIESKNLDAEEVNRTAARAALGLPHVFRVYTREQLMNGAAMEDQVGRRVMNGFYARRSADVYILLEPYWMFSMDGTTHGTTFGYDAHVPLIFLGPGIKAGKFYQSVAINDIAPTLAAILDIEPPSGSVGRVLSEIFDR